MGDSITAGWDLKTYFPGRNYVNRGMSGQITSQFLERFRKEVLEERPAAVVILGGANDISRAIPVDTIVKNIAKMALLADEQGIHVFISSVMPLSPPACCDGFSAKPIVLAINERLEKFSKDMGFSYLDYYSALVDDCGGLTDSLTFDGAHLKKEGYDILSRIVSEPLNHIKMRNAERID